MRKEFPSEQFQITCFSSLRHVQYKTFYCKKLVLGIHVSISVDGKSVKCLGSKVCISFHFFFDGLIKSFKIEDNVTIEVYM